MNHIRDNCRLCSSKKLINILNLNPSALANDFNNNKDKQELYPLDLYKCEECDHIQLLYIVDPKVLFSNYLYVSGTSNLMKQHFKDYAYDIISKFNLNNQDLVIEFGSNDSILLKEIKVLGPKVLGIEPATNLAKISNEEGITTVNEFLTIDIAKDIVKKYGKAKIVIANNVFAHIDQLNKIVEAVKILLEPKGTFIFENAYLFDMLDTNDFSQIYHEHLSYHSVTPLYKFFEHHNMNLYDVEHKNIHGGSIRCFVGTKAISQNVFNFINYENINFKYLLSNFINKTNDFKVSIYNNIQQLKDNGSSIGGVLASAKSTTLLHQAGIGVLLDFIADEAELKQGLYSPGYKIPIVNFDNINDVDYLVILSLNFANSIMERYKDYKGKWIVLFPEFDII